MIVGLLQWIGVTVVASLCSAELLIFILSRN
jgi:hypothetical protein